MRRTMIFFAALALVAGVTVAAAGEKPVSETAACGPYSITLKVLPAEAFTGKDAEMVRDGGAQPVTLGSDEMPNHHLVVFVKKGSEPVEDADVTIRYHQTDGEADAWTDLPVVRMHVAGKSLATTHYGNNVHLAPGPYEVRVTVNGSGPAVLDFTLE